MNDEPKGDYAEVNGLELYYEVHGAGRPLVVLHGAYMTIGMLERSCLAWPRPAR